jgi:nucleotide-binding universal stress UspA family protein
MSFRRILVHVEADEQTDRRLATAAALASRFDAMLVGLAAGTIQPPPADPTFGDPGWLQIQRDQIEEDFAAARAKFLAAAPGGEWRTAFSTPAAALTVLTSTADIAIVGPQSDAAFWNAARMLNLGEFLMHAGRPVFIVPDAGGPAEFGSAMVAWKNTREAQRAVADALPLLKSAGRVTIVHVREGSVSDDTATECRHFLKGHAIAAEIAMLNAADGPADRQLTDFAGEQGVDLIVAGAYGHSRLREWVLGGVTRQFLTQSPVSCLISH